MTTTDDLIVDALWRAGEPTGGSSDFQTQVLSYLNDVQNLLVMGGTLGSRDIAASAGLYGALIDIPVTDWPWLRKNPRGVFNTTPAVDSTGTVTVTNGLTTVSFSNPPPIVAGWRLLLKDAAAGIPSIPRTVARFVSAFELDIPWPQETQTTSAWAAFQLEYRLAADFVRLTGSPIVHASGAGNTAAELDVTIGQGSMEDEWPLPSIEAGAPTAAAFVDPSTIQLNRYDTRSYRIEYPYVFQPPALVAGQSQIPIHPGRYLALLSIGAAMLVAQDKADAKTDRLASEFREMLSRMTQEFRKHLAVASETYGRFVFRGRRYQDGRLVRTASGQIIW